MNVESWRNKDKSDNYEDHLQIETSTKMETLGPKSGNPSQGNLTLTGRVSLEDQHMKGIETQYLLSCTRGLQNLEEQGQQDLLAQQQFNNQQQWWQGELFQYTHLGGDLHTIDAHNNYNNRQLHSHHYQNCLIIGTWNRNQ